MFRKLWNPNIFLSMPILPSWPKNLTKNVFSIATGHVGAPTMTTVLPSRWFLFYCRVYPTVCNRNKKQCLNVTSYPFVFCVKSLPGTSNNVVEESKPRTGQSKISKSARKMHSLTSYNMYKERYIIIYVYIKNYQYFTLCI